jgi:uncharacterized membrane protein YcaP (DUF421 family)
MTFAQPEWSEVFRLSVSPAELIVRGTIMFWFLFGVFRFVLRRDVGSVGVSDFLFVVILGDAAQNAMIGQATSTTDGMVLISTLVGWNYLMDWLSYRVPLIERLTTPPPLRLVENGRMLRRNMRREFITPDELMAKLREQGHSDLSCVRQMCLEADGESSVIAKHPSK